MGAVTTGETMGCWSERGAAPGEKKFAIQASIRAVKLFGPKGSLKGKKRTDFSSIEAIMDGEEPANEQVADINLPFDPKKFGKIGLRIYTDIHIIL